MADVQEDVICGEQFVHADLPTTPRYFMGQQEVSVGSWPSVQPKRQFIRPPSQVAQHSLQPQPIQLSQPPQSFTKRQFLGQPPQATTHETAMVGLSARVEWRQAPWVGREQTSSVEREQAPWVGTSPTPTMDGLSRQAHSSIVGVGLVPTPTVPAQPSVKLKKQKKQKAKMTRGKRIRRWFAVCSILTVIVVIFMSQANGESGAWTADVLRAVVGPTLTARIESWYLGLSDTTHQVQYRLSGQHVDAPWTVNTSTPVATAATAPEVVKYIAMPLNRIAPMVSPAINGEGVWLTQGMAPSPYGYLPLDAKAFIRPDPSHPYAIVTLLQFDMRFFRLHMVAGTTEPGGPRGFNGPGAIPAADQQGNALLAAFNGGFKYADGQYGLKTNGVVYVPPQPNAATIAVTKGGQIILGAWGVDSRLNSGNANLVAWRQNASLLIDHGKINPLTQDGAAWGGTILNSAYTWRSGIGITASGTLLYAAGSYLTAFTLGEALHAAGAVMAMQTDINPFWVRAFLYSRGTHGTLSISKLNPAMYGVGTEYLYGTERDFFYMTRFAPPPPQQPPPPTRTRETTPQ